MGYIAIEGGPGPTRMRVYDIASGETIQGVRSFTVHAAVGDLVTADMEVLLGGLGVSIDRKNVQEQLCFPFPEY